MVLSACSPGCAFSLISWLFISQSGHTIYQIKAGYLNYRMVPVILLLVKGFKIFVLKSTKIVIFCHHFLIVDSSFIISDRLFKISMVITDMPIEGSVFQIFYLGPGLCFM